MDRLSLQQERLSLACAEVQNVLDHIEQCVGHHTDSEFMGMHAELACQIQRGFEECNEGVVSLEPVEKVDVGVEVRCAEALQQLCQTKAKLTQLSIATAKCTVSGKGAKAAVLNTISEASLTTTKCNRVVNCHLQTSMNLSSSHEGSSGMLASPLTAGTHGVWACGYCTFLNPAHNSQM